MTQLDMIKKKVAYLYATNQEIHVNIKFAPSTLGNKE